MVIFILDTIIIILSLCMLMFDYLYIKSSKIDLNKKIKRYVFGAIELLIIGVVLVLLTIIGSREMIISLEFHLLLICIGLSILIYIGLILLWNRLFVIISSSIDKKNLKGSKYKFKSISIYGLVYCFGFLFYLIYGLIFFK